MIKFDLKSNINISLIQCIHNNKNVKKHSNNRQNYRFTRLFDDRPLSCAGYQPSYKSNVSGSIDVSLTF